MCFRVLELGFEGLAPLYAFETALNDTLESERIFFSESVSSADPQLSSISEPHFYRLSVTERPDVADTVLQEVEKVLSKMTLNCALHHCVLSACDHSF